MCCVNIMFVLQENVFVGLFWVRIQVWAHNKFLGGIIPIKCFFFIFFDLLIKAVKTPRREDWIFFPLSPKCCRTPHGRAKRSWFCLQMASFGLKKLFPSLGDLQPIILCVFLGKSEFIPHFHPPFQTFQPQNI